MRFGVRLCGRIRAEGGGSNGLDWIVCVFWMMDELMDGWGSLLEEKL